MNGFSTILTCCNAGRWHGWRSHTSLTSLFQEARARAACMDSDNGVATIPQFLQQARAIQLANKPAGRVERIRPPGDKRRNWCPKVPVGSDCERAATHSCAGKAKLFKFCCSVHGAGSHDDKHCVVLHPELKDTLTSGAKKKKVQLAAVEQLAADLAQVTLDLAQAEQTHQAYIAGAQATQQWGRGPPLHTQPFQLTFTQHQMMMKRLTSTRMSAATSDLHMLDSAATRSSEMHKDMFLDLKLEPRGSFTLGPR